MADDLFDVPLSAHRTLWTGREMVEEIAALRKQLRQAEQSRDSCRKLCDEQETDIARALDLVEKTREQLRQAEERAERAESLLAKAVEFRLDEERHWSIVRRPYGPECWRLMNGVEWVKEYPTLDAALAAYEQSREKRP